MELAPVIVFSYNRPVHLGETINRLSQNELASETDLFIFCDGAKPGATDDQRQKVIANREVAKKAKGFRSVHVCERENNYGLARNIIEGVSLIIDDFGKVIVLEDDLLTSRYFLKYMNEALDYYEKRPGVMSISANRPPVNRMMIPSDYEYDVFVSLRSFSTGWATWKDRWSRVDWSLGYLDELMKHPEQVRAFNRAGDDMSDMLLLQRNRIIDSWAIQFCFAHFKEHSVAILPCIPYVDNIGFDGSGIHSGTDETDFRNDVDQAVKDPRFVDVLYEDSRIINSFYNYYCRKRRPLWKKVFNFIARKLGKQPVFKIKKPVYA